MKNPFDNLKFPAYQRELKMSKVNKIANNFMPDIVGIGLVSFRGGEFNCLDSRHRVMAMKKLGFKEILCQVGKKEVPQRLPELELKKIPILTGLTYEEECLRFNVLNTGRTQLTANQVFHCRVEGRDKEALELVEMFKKYRFDYNKNNGIKENNLIGAVSKFVKIQKSFGIDRVEKVLRILRNAWYGDKNSLSSAIITGLSTFLEENPTTDEMTLVKALEKVMPNILIAQANNYVKCDMLRPGRADSACYHVAKIISQLYEEESTKPKKRTRITAI